MTNDNARLRNTPPTLADIQQVLHNELNLLLADVVRKDELAEALADLVTKHELERRLQALESQQPELDAKIASQREAIAVVEQLFHDIKASIEGITGRLDNYGQVIDARHEEVDALRTDQQQAERDMRHLAQELGDVQARQRALRHAIFGTGDPHGPIAFADRVMAALERLDHQMSANHETVQTRFGQLEAKLSATNHLVAEHSAFIERRRSLERLVYRCLAALWSRPLWRRLLLLVIGGSSSIALFEVLRTLLG
jgi:DNA repair exonuclease SbcCD ATPase subunit